MRTALNAFTILCFIGAVGTAYKMLIETIDNRNELNVWWFFLSKKEKTTALVSSAWLIFLISSVR